MWSAYDTCTSYLGGRGCNMASGFLSDLVRSFLVGLTGKTSTVKSAAEVEVPGAYRGVPIIDPEKCILCGRCGQVCPAGLLHYERARLRKRCAYSWDIAFFAVSALWFALCPPSL